MLIELGQTAPKRVDHNDPAVTYLHIPEADEHGLGGYSLEPGMDARDFREHIDWAYGANGGITQLPGHEILLAVHHAQAAHGYKDPAWIRVTPHDLTPDHHQPEVERFLSDYYKCDVGAPADLEQTHHTKYGPPGQGPNIYEQAGLPNLTALFTNDGRIQQSINYGGGQVGATGKGTAANATTFTTNLTLTTNAWTGYRIYAADTTNNQVVWGNIISNNNTGGASVVTIDRWYAPATPGGAAGTTPAAGFQFILADGGSTSAWFMGLTATTSGGFLAADHTLAGEITTASGGLIRKICPYALTSSTSPGTFTLTPVFTANGSDSLPVTVASYGVFTSMVTSFGGAGGPMKFEGALNATATFSLSGDNATITYTVTES